MSENLRALFVILLLAALAFTVSKSMLAPIIGSEPFGRRWAAWLGSTLVLFLANNQWIYLLGTLAVVVPFARRDNNPIALYLMLLLAAPPFEVRLPGLGIAQYLADVSHSRLLALAILLPAALQLRKHPRLPRLGSTTVDKLLLVFVAYTGLLLLRDTTLTDTLRQLTYAGLDVVLLYYVASRTLTTRAAAREVLVTCVTVAILLALMAIFESARTWLLYSSVASSLGASQIYNAYLYRDGALRASVTTGQSLALGYFFVIALGALLHVSGFVHNLPKRIALTAALALGLLASFARAPWIAGVLLFLVHAPLSEQAVPTFLKRAAVIGLASLAVIVSPVGDRIVALLPYVGTVDSFNVNYRERLIDAAWPVFLRQPWTGSATYLATPEMRTMIQGQGIIDMVNAYLEVVMAYGLIGLGLFVAMFVLALKRVLAMAGDLRLDLEARSLAAALSATTVVVLLMIYTVSSITIVPTFYWLLLGMLCAVAGMPLLAARSARTG